MDLPIPLHLSRVNNLRAIVNSYFSEYIENTMQPNLQEFFEFAQDKDQKLNKEMTSAQWAEDVEEEEEEEEENTYHQEEVESWMELQEENYLSSFEK